MCLSPQRRALCRHRSLQKWSEDVLFVIFWLWNVLRVTTTCTFSTSQLQKVLWTWSALCILTWNVHFMNISTSNSDEKVMCFARVDYEMCSAPQPCALSQHLNFQKCSRTCQFLTHLTSNWASRHNGGHFLNIWTAKSAPTIRCFVHVDFDKCCARQRPAIFDLSSPQMAPHPQL